MKPKALGIFRSKFFKPCTKLLLIFKLRLKKPVFIRALRRPHKTKSRKPFNRKPMSSSFFSVFCSPKKSRDMKMLECLTNPSINVPEAESSMIFPSPLTPAYVRGEKRDGCEEVEDACRSFEKYLVEMIVEEGKTRDLMDVEEFLYCWKKLKCPVFIDLVSRFYGELCKDLFSSQTIEEAHLSH